MQQQLKSISTEFATLILNAPDSSLTEFLTIIENTEKQPKEIIKRRLYYVFCKNNP